MTTTHTRTKFLTAAVGAVIATMAAPPMLILGAATAQATPDISKRAPVGIINHLKTPRDCGSCDGFNQQQDPAGYPNLLPALTHPDILVGTPARPSVPGSAMTLHLLHQNPARAHERAVAGATN